MHKRPKSIELYFIDGDPEGMQTATIPFQWTGHVLVAGRTQLREALKREESHRPGVYLLLGENEEEPMLYIGESDDIGERIKTHDAKKEWWSTVVFITSSGDQLNKAHARYLESRLIEKANAVNKIKLDNNTAPPSRSLSEAGVTHMEDFLDNIYIVLPALKFDFFIENTRTLSSLQKSKSTEVPVFILNTPKHGLSATASLIEGHFIVEQGSLARANWEGVGSKHMSYAKLHYQLVEQGVLVRAGDKCTFAKSYAFKSASAAAAVINGRPTNGTTAWKLKDGGKTYKEWEAETLDQ